MDGKQIADCFAACFNTPAGKKVLEYLEQTTIRQPTPPDISDDELRGLEGSRRLVFTILNFIKQGEHKHD